MYLVPLIFHQMLSKVILKILQEPKPILVYCLSGGRSDVTTSILQQNGVSETYNGGGIYNFLSILNNN